MRELGVTYTAEERRRLLVGLPNISLSGAAGSGKDTAGEFLTGFGYRQIAWADRLREICQGIWPDEPLEQDYREKLTSIGRAIEKAEGVTEPGAFTRGLSKQSLGTIDIEIGRKRPVVVTDTRFQREYADLKERGFIMLRLTVPREQQIARLIANGKFKSEEYLDSDIEHYLDDFEFDAEFENTGDVQGLYEWLTSVVRKYMDR